MNKNEIAREILNGIERIVKECQYKTVSESLITEFISKINMLYDQIYKTHNIEVKRLKREDVILDNGTANISDPCIIDPITNKPIPLNKWLTY